MSLRFLKSGLPAVQLQSVPRIAVAVKGGALVPFRKRIPTALDRPGRKRGMRDAGIAVVTAALVAVVVVVGSAPVRRRPTFAVTVDAELGWERVGVNRWVQTRTGATYRGDAIQFLNDTGMVPHGHGRCHVPGVATYTGQWQNGRMHGEGEYVPAGGSVTFRGRFKRGARFGFGDLSHTDGWRYEGHYLNGKRHGHGKWTDNEGQVLEGQWRQGRFEGRGRVILSDGRSLNGQFTGWAPEAHIAQGSFSGKMFDAVGRQVLHIDQWTWKNVTY